MIVKFLPNNTVEFHSGHWFNGAYTQEGVFPLGELSLSVLDYDYGDILDAMSTFVDKLKYYNYSECTSESVASFLARLKPLEDEYLSLFEPIKSTPLFRFTDDYEFLYRYRDLFDFFYDKAEDELTINDVLDMYANDEFIKEAESGFQDILDFQKQWRATVDSIDTFKTLYEFLYIERPKISLGEKIAEYGLEKFNKLLYSKHKIDSEFGIELNNNELVFAETLALNFPHHVGETVLPFFLRREIIKILQADLRVKRCKNCNRMFIISGGYDNLYCSNVPDGETQACNIIGPHRQYVQRTYDDPHMQIYKRVYKRLYARRKNDKQKGIAFLNWSESASKLKDEPESKALSLEAFESLLLSEAAKHGL